MQIGEKKAISNPGPKVINYLCLWMAVPCAVSAIFISGQSKLPYTRVNKRNSLLGAYWLLSACFFPGFAPG